MKLVTQTDHLGHVFGDENAIRILAESGYDGIDYSMFAMNEGSCPLSGAEYIPYVKKLKKTAENYGLTYEQAHAPFASMREGDEEYNNMMDRLLKRSIEIAGMLEAKIIVVHPVQFSSNQLEQNMELYHRLEPYAKKYGVKIALENMWGYNRELGKIVPNVCSVAEDFNRYYDALDPDVFTCCLDLGHCGLVGDNAASMIREMGSNRLGCLHIHDNDNIHDSHTLPYTMSMDWDDIISALGEIDFKGNFTYEADNFIAQFPDDLKASASRFMAEVGRSMMRKIELARSVK